MLTSMNYSGIITKVKAMNTKLISRDDIQKISALESVSDLIAFLKKHPGYHDLFQKYDEREIHRSEAERIFINGLYLDYTKIYRFANDEQRSNLELVFFRYEINVLKACIRLIRNNENAFDLQLFYPFFSRHSQINVSTLSSSRSMEEYINNLRGTEYYAIFNKLNAKGNLSSFDYEMALDVYYFTKSWKRKDKIMKGNNKKAFIYRLGTEIDLLNIMWMYRSKKMYEMGASDIFTYLIPINYKLSMAMLTKLLATVTPAEFLNLLSATHYKDFVTHLQAGTMEKEYGRIIGKIFRKNLSRYPTSMVPVHYYLFRKDQEIRLLTSAMECIRYGYDQKKMLDILTQ